MLSSLHDTRDLLEARLGMLRLRAANDHGGAAAIAAAAAAAAARAALDEGDRSVGPLFGLLPALARHDRPHIHVLRGEACVRK